MSKNLSELSGRKGIDHNLFEQLGIAATDRGTPSLEDMDRLREEFLVGKGNVFGTVSFYDFLRPENQGKKVYICNGSACRTAGTQESLHTKLRQHFSSQEIGEMCCLGRCHENHAFQVNGLNYSGKDIDRIKNILNDKSSGAERYSVQCSGTPVLTADYGSASSYYTIFKDILQRSSEEILEEIRLSGLRGRGGAGFPIATKMAACRSAEGEPKFIVCNADEGDPGAFSDRYLMEQRPHALLMGMLIAGYVCNARYGVVYIRGEYPESVNRIQEAINELESSGLVGDTIAGSSFSFRIKVIKAQGAYICGEETALLNSIEGQRPEVRTRPPYPAQKGLFNRPTIVNNVETLACLPWIIKNGGKAYASIGTAKSSGTKLVSLDGHFNHPGIIEADMGTPLSVILNDLGGGFRVPVKAMHIGGPLGGLVPVTEADKLTLDFERFSEAGFLLGHASVVCIPQEYPMIDYIEHLFRFTAHESCGKCFPCRLGSTRGYEMIDKARNSDYRLDSGLLNDLLETLEKGSLCALGGGLPLPIKNALHYFKEELQPYFNH